MSRTSAATPAPARRPARSVVHDREQAEIVEAAIGAAVPLVPHRRSPAAHPRRDAGRGRARSSRGVDIEPWPPSRSPCPAWANRSPRASVSRWLKPDGSPSRRASRCFELETDKASSAVPAPGSGVLKIGVAEGETVAIGATVGTIDPSGAPPAAAATAAAPAGSRRRQRAPAAPAAPERCRRRRTIAPLSPAVRRLVAEEGVDVARVAGTGPGGRVTKGDVLTYLESPPGVGPARGRRPRPRRGRGPGACARPPRPPQRRPAGPARPASG